MEEFFTLDIVSTGDVCSKCICFYRKLKRLRLIGNRTSSRAILSVIVLEIDKSNDRWYDYRPNWTPFGPTTIINHREKQSKPNAIPDYFGHSIENFSVVLWVVRLCGEYTILIIAESKYNGTIQPKSRTRHPSNYPSNLAYMTLYCQIRPFLTTATILLRETSSLRSSCCFRSRN